MWASKPQIRLLSEVRVSTSNILARGGGAVGKSFDPASGRLGVRIPVAKNLSRKNR